MGNARTVDSILYEALYHAEARSSGLTARESSMYRRVRADLEKYGGYVAAYDRVPDYEVEEEGAEVEEEEEDVLTVSDILDDTGDEKPAGERPRAASPFTPARRSEDTEPDGERKKAAIVFKVAPDELARQLDGVWPVDEETGEDLPVNEVSRPELVQEARVVLQEMLGGFVPTAVAARLVDLYLAVRREYDSQVKLLESMAGVSDERRPSMRDSFEKERLQTASESLAEAAPYEWGRTSLVVG